MWKRLTQVKQTTTKPGYQIVKIGSPRKMGQNSINGSQRQPFHSGSRPSQAGSRKVTRFQLCYQSMGIWKESERGALTFDTNHIFPRSAGGKDYSLFIGWG